MAARRSQAVAAELGVSSDSQKRGHYNPDEFLPKLRGIRAMRTYREMRDNDAVVGATLAAMDMILEAVEWRFEPADDSDAALEGKTFAETLIDDMSHTFQDFIAEALSFLPYGFSYFETVFKRRVGPYENDASRRSRYSDGKIGIRKLAPRPQWTLEEYLLDSAGGIEGFWQVANSKRVFLPVDKCLLFRTSTLNNNPTGRSVLRNAYTAYHYLNEMQQIEAVAVERELNGLPVGYIPGRYLRSDANAAQQAVRNSLIAALRDVKFNDQGFLLLPSDPWTDEDGKMTTMRQIDVKLMASEGKRDMDTNKIIIRYQQDIARSVLADFIMLGQNDRGSFSMSKNKSDIFLRSIEGYLAKIVAVLNRHLLPRVWNLNGMDLATMPTFATGRVAPIDLDELGNYVSRLSGAGAALFPDEALELELRRMADLPDPSGDGRAVPTDAPTPEDDDEPDRPDA